MSAALAPALPAPVCTAVGIHAIGPVPFGIPRAMKRAHARQMPSWALRADVTTSRGMILRPYPGPYSGPVLIARCALNAARARAALAVRGEPMRTMNLHYDELGGCT